MDQFDTYFVRADTDRDGRISGNEALAFFQGANLPKQVLAQIWTYANQNQATSLGRQEFYNALKLVTVAQSKRDLTPDLVKAALYGPASSQIPAPKINIPAIPGVQSNMRPSASPLQPGVQSNMRPSASPLQPGGSMSSTPGLAPSQPNQFSRPPRPSPPVFQPQGIPTQGMPSSGSMPVANRPSTAQVGLGPVVSPATQVKTPEVAGKEEPKPHLPGTNGFAPISGFGDMFSATPLQPKDNSTAPKYSAGSIPSSSAMTPTPSKEQPTAGSNSGRPPTVQSQQFNLMGKAAENHGSAPSQPPWPRMTQSDIQKYSKIFLQVDKDRDGKITGLEARNLFFSWKLPREVLKQVWDLSDQDSDSMLSLREFCIALYLIERCREGRPLPAVLPISVIFEGVQFPAPGQTANSVSNPSWRPAPGVQQSQMTKPPSVPGRPPRPVPIPQPEEPIQQKARVPVLEKNLVDQLSTEEQDSLNKKFQEAKDAEKKVADLEKDILEAKHKIQFYHAKMQELILYKSQCDNRLNEITEKVVADKREAESLAKKYEEKYKQAGDVASKLTIEEATFRDIQEKKMELYRAIVKLDHENADGIQDRTNQIQSDLEELVKALNERCKTYGLRAKPTSVVELPFGWQAGISGTAADWDENWDKFEDEGFTFVKELTLDVENVIAPPKPKTPLIREKVTTTDIGGTAKSPSKADDNKSELQNSEDLDETATPPASPSNAVESPSKEIQELRTMKDYNLNGSPHAFDTESKFGGPESIFSGDKGFDEPPSWGSFDTHYDSDAAWDPNPTTPKVVDHESYSESSLFGGDNWNLNPIKTGTDSFSKQGPFFDSVPSTPLYNSTTSPNADSLFGRNSPFVFDSVPSTPAYNSSSPRRGAFADSVPGTPMYNFSTSQERGAFADSVPSTPMYNFSTSQEKGAFADSVPSTPMYNSSTSPRRFSEGSEDNYGFDSFSRFDSFNMQDTGPFGSRDTLSRFDSMRSSRDSVDFDGGYFASNQSLARFDSFRSTADSDYNFGQSAAPEPFSRFDSMRSTRDSDYGHGFPSFDDSDPFGSSDPFKSSQETQTPRKDSDSWKAF